MRKPTLAAQASAVTQAVALVTANREMGEPALSWLKQAAVTLGAMSECEELMRAAYRLHKEAPAVAMLLQAFPGSTISDVRETE